MHIYMHVYIVSLMYSIDGICLYTYMYTYIVVHTVLNVISNAHVCRHVPSIHACMYLLCVLSFYKMYRFIMQSTQD